MEQRIDIAVPVIMGGSYLVRYSPPVLMKSGHLLYKSIGLYGDFKKEIEGQIVNVRKRGGEVLINLLNIDRSPLIRLVRGLLEIPMEED